MGEAREAMADRYVGEHASLADYVQELTEGGTAIPQPLRFYVDWQAMARDAEINGDLFTVQTAFDVVRGVLTSSREWRAHIETNRQGRLFD